MNIGNAIFLVPAVYLIIAAIVVLLLGVIAARRPDKGLDHWLPSQYLAPALMIPALVMTGLLVVMSIKQYSLTQGFNIGDDVVVTASAVAAFVTAQGAQLVFDPFALIFTFIAIAGTFLVMLISLDHFGEYQIHKGEYYSLLIFACSAVCIAAAASDILAVYLSLEFLSLVSYVLAAYSKEDRRSGEAGLKYFLYGAACSAIMLYGMSILFGVTGGSTSFTSISRGLTAEAAASGALWVGMMFILVGLGFKIALVPFQFWAPDTYEGAPTPVTAFLSVVSKAAGIAVLVRFLGAVGLPASGGSFSWYWILVVLASLSMFFGNMVAIPQTNIKRMLAYSSIAQVGYIMVGVLAMLKEMSPFAPSTAVVSADKLAGFGTAWASQGVMIYMFAYLAMNLGAFAVAIVVGRCNGSDKIGSYAGLMHRSPFYAVALTVFLISLAGIPPTVGFLGKFFIFAGALKTSALELVILAIIGVVNSVISAYYYLNVVRLMFFGANEDKRPVRGSLFANAAVTVALILTLVTVLFAGPLTGLTTKALTSPSVSSTLTR